MQVIQGLDSWSTPLDRSVLTIGNFDGVHCAHQRLIETARARAGESGGPVVVLTFDPHPLAVVAPGREPERLQPLDEKLRYLADAGADVTVVARSKPALLELEPEQFIDEVIRDRFRPAHIVEGPSFGFGRARRGTPELLKQRAATFDCCVHIVDPVSRRLSNGETHLVSSSLVRRLLGEGQVEDARLALGRPYVLIGTVVRGQGRGKTIGFPTANVAPMDQLVPAEGVYAGRTRLDQGAYLCAISIGTTPTFNGAQRQIEAHLLDFDESIYNASIRIEFDRFLRTQRKFDSVEALTEQLRCDVDDVRHGNASHRAHGTTR